MIISVISDQDTDNRLQYTLRFILRTLGYDYNFISSGSKVPDETLLLTYMDVQRSAEFENYQPLHIFKSGQLNTLDELEKNINLFDWQGLSLPLLGKQIGTTPKNTWHIRKTEGYFSTRGRMDWYIGFDLIANVFYHLSRYEEKWRHFAEETATDYSTSILSRYQQLKVPVIDVLLEFFDRLIQKRAIQNKQTLLKILNWPSGEDFGVALTHDVDLTRGVSLKERLFNKGLDVVQMLSGAHQEKQRRKTELRERDAIYWSYPQMISFYQKHKWQSTFFFLTRLFEGLHVRYDITTKKFRNLINDLQKNGHEIGLHSSLKAFDRRGRYKEEKERIESVLSKKCTGLRQHYLRAKYPRLWKLAEHAGFNYDSSLAYNFQSGFRAGTSHPFQAYEYDEDRELSVIEFSLLCFENNLPIDDGAESIIAGLIEQVARFHGLFVALWHPSNFVREPYQTVWNSMTAELKKYHIWVNTLAEHYDWHSGRAQLKIMSNQEKISIHNPAGLKSFAVKILGQSQLTGTESADVEKQPQNIYLIHSKRKELSLTISK